MYFSLVAMAASIDLTNSSDLCGICTLERPLLARHQMHCSTGTGTRWVRSADIDRELRVIYTPVVPPGEEIEVTGWTFAAGAAST
jgi:hypothetical protein